MANLGVNENETIKLRYLINNIKEFINIKY
jgi:hypothetical protein